MTKILRTFDIAQLISTLEQCGPDTKVYFGADSSRFRRDGKWFATYTTVVIVHMNGSQGCRVFGEVTQEEDFDRAQKYRPMHRMLTETSKVIDMYQRVMPEIERFFLEIEGFDIAIHLDINPNEMHASSCAVTAAIGMVQSMCNVVPMVKPDAFAASYAADQFGAIADSRNVKCVTPLPPPKYQKKRA